MSANEAHLMTREETLSSLFRFFFFTRSEMCHMARSSPNLRHQEKRSDPASAICARHRLPFESTYVSEKGYDLLLAELLAERGHLATTVCHRINKPLVINSFLPF